MIIALILHGRILNERISYAYVAHYLKETGISSNLLSSHADVNKMMKNDHSNYSLKSITFGSAVFVCENM